MLETLKPLIKQFMPFAQKQMGFIRPPKLFLRTSSSEADNPLGKTGFYDPQEESITLYIAKRHPKDILRSLSHELMHHTQKCNGEFEKTSNMGEQGYAQTDPHMRNMEIQAYQASIVFRDWEDSLKETIYYEHLQKGENTMSTKDWKNKELTTLLSEAWGFKFNSLQEFDEFNGKGEIQEEGADDTEVQEEGGAAARTGNEEKDQGRDRMHADRVHEEAEVDDSDAEVQEEGEKKPDEDGDGVPDWADKKKDDDNVEEQISEEVDEDAVEESKDEDLKEAIKILLTKYLKG
jgi:hypothetical protein